MRPARASNINVNSWH